MKPVADTGFFSDHPPPLPHLKQSCAQLSKPKRLSIYVTLWIEEVVENTTLSFPCGGLWAKSKRFAISPH